MQNVCDILSNIELGQAQSYKNLTVVPLRLRNPVINNALLPLEEAGDFVDFQELPDAEVSSLMAVNRGALPVLIPEGSLVRNNRQDRVVIHTVILNNHPLSIDVRCVEQGRWQASSIRGNKSKYHAYSSLRKKMYLHKANQGEVWRDIDKKGRKMGIRSDTGTAEAIYKDYDHELEGYAKAFCIGADTNGMVVLIDGAVVGTELFTVKGIFKRLFHSLISSYALDAIDKEKPEHVLTVDEFLKQMGAGAQTVDGNTITLKSEAIEGKAYLHEDTVIHMATFIV